MQRVQRQRNVIREVIAQIKDLGLLELNGLLDTVLSQVTVEQMTIPAEGTYGSMRGMDGRILFAVDFETNAKLLREALYGPEETEGEANT